MLSRCHNAEPQGTNIGSVQASFSYRHRFTPFYFYMDTVLPCFKGHLRDVSFPTAGPCHSKNRHGRRYILVMSLKDPRAELFPYLEPNVKTAIIEESRLIDSGISPAKQSCSLRDGKRGLQVSLRFDTAGALEDLRNHPKCP